MSSDTPIKDHGAERQLFLWRTVVAGVIMALMVGGLITRLAYLQVVEHGYYTLRSDDNRTRVQVVPPVRGLIYDRNGIVLADNLPAYRLEIIPEQVADIDATLDRLAEVVTISDRDRQRFFERMRKQPRFRGIPIRLNLSQREVARFEVNRRDFPGLEIRAGLTRHYPMGEVAAHLIGYVGGITEADQLIIDDKRYRGSTHIGRTGVEASHEDKLHGRPGSRLLETNAMGRALRELSFTPPQPGESLYLTVDAHIQRVAYQALGNHAGSVVALDPKTGGVLAMVSKPSFEPGLFVDGISRKNYQQLLDHPFRPLFNRSLQGQYPPGSTVKPVMALAALDRNSIDPTRRVWCPGYIQLPGSDRRWRDWKREGHGWLNMQEAIFRSSDVYFYKLGMDLGIDAMHRYATLFGLGHRTGVDLPRENAGLMPSREWKNGTRQQPWFPGETLNTVIGQGFMSATPLQLAHMTAELATRGNAKQPHVLMASQRDSNASREPYQPPAAEPIRLADESDWSVVAQAMESVVHARRGTANVYVDQGLNYRMAGKSGTAQVAALAQDEEAPEYDEIEHRFRDHALFVAYAPADDPEIAVAVVAEHGGGGSSTAGPIARRVIDAALEGPRLVQSDNAR
ncbi:penicillin-binding protein 2 [Spectribacter hydrogenoxidans]|uniref:Peptidoglycan D,D-transpeptidase MrdA n=1 Tax=Spectribacter hydrogenoxidans TaxID=3075608 RepID=A0ABU3C063_9GAMM|nr:penicillin-binding protein 2 [Salinisphaera sp. W335]MDT0634952.1 penicillin-binding protein 2 [Salinisphaera sp. W335]